MGLWWGWSPEPAAPLVARCPLTSTIAWRRRGESNPCTGLCRPLPEPLGHAASLAILPTGASRDAVARELDVRVPAGDQLPPTTQRLLAHLADPLNGDGEDRFRLVEGDDLP